MAVPLDPRRSVPVARQPILDAKGRVYRCELLYRAQQTDRACTTAGDLAAARVATLLGQTGPMRSILDAVVTSRECRSRLGN